MLVLCPFTLTIQATRSSERSVARPRSPPLPAHLKNAPSAPPGRSASQRPTRTSAIPPTPPKVEPSRSRAAAKPPPSAAKPVPKATAKTPPPSRSSRVRYRFYLRKGFVVKVFHMASCTNPTIKQCKILKAVSSYRHPPKLHLPNQQLLDSARE